jgi:hypothetical protein
MKASAFVTTYKGRGHPAWEAAAVALAKEGGALASPAIAVDASTGGVLARFFVAGDYLTLGEPGDAMRMPLGAPAAQTIADDRGALLPTKKMVDLIWKAAGTRLAPHPMRAEWQAKGLNPDQRMVQLDAFAEHDAVIDRQLAPFVAGGTLPGQLIAGHKKDVVLTNHTAPGHVAIYGWHQIDGKPIQPLNGTSHALGYADYSHGVRLVHPEMEIDGKLALVAEVLVDPKRAAFLSDEAR